MFQRISDFDNAVAALTSLSDEFVPSEACVRYCRLVLAKEIPAPFHDLLVHGDHMTAVLASYYGRAVSLKVLTHHTADHRYSRQVLLTIPGGAVVEFGIVRLDLSVVSDAVREEILSRRIPLGDILVRHNVLRHIAPQWYLCFSAASPIRSFFGEDAPQDVYGRIGIIYCNGRPAIELLEVVRGAWSDRKEPQADRRGTP